MRNAIRIHCGPALEKVNSLPFLPIPSIYPSIYPQWNSDNEGYGSWATDPGDSFPWYTSWYMKATTAGSVVHCAVAADFLIELLEFPRHFCVREYMENHTHRYVENCQNLTWVQPVTFTSDCQDNLSVSKLRTPAIQWAIPRQFPKGP